MHPILIHGSTIEIKGKAVLISGKSGMGKSSLALQLMDRGGLLVADDQTLISFEEKELVTRAPASIQGMMEVRGIGICTFPFQESSPLSLCVEICEEKTLERLPERLFIEYYGIQVPLLKLEKADPLGAIKVELRLGKR